MSWILMTSLTLECIGTMMTAFVVLFTHDRIRKNGVLVIDDDDDAQMAYEHIIIVIGIIFIMLGWVLAVLDAMKKWHETNRLEHLHQKYNSSPSLSSKPPEI